MLSVRRDGKDLINLVKTSPFSTERFQSQFQDRVIDWMPEDGHHILIELNVDNGRSPAVLRVDLDTGERQIVHPLGFGLNPQDLYIAANHEGRPMHPLTRWPPAT
jgi:hypothetical protein